MQDVKNIAVNLMDKYQMLQTYVTQKKDGAIHKMPTSTETLTSWTQQREGLVTKCDWGVLDKTRVTYDSEEFRKRNQYWRGALKNTVRVKDL